MTVGELIELLEQHPKGVEVLIDCRNLDNSIVFSARRLLSRWNASSSYRYIRRSCEYYR